MYRKIILPLDGSEFAETALSLATETAARGAAELILVNVVTTFVPLYANVPASGAVFDAAHLEREMREQMSRYLEGVAERIRGVHPFQVTTALLGGSPGDSIVEYARSQNADLVVMATHGRGGMNRAWLGSVAEWVVRHVHVPVLLMRPDESEVGTESAELHVHASFPPSAILVPVQESDTAEGIIPHAAAFARAFGARLVLLHVVIPLELRQRIPEPRIVDNDDELLQNAIRRGEAYLAEVMATLTGGGLSVTAHVETAPSAAAAILRLAEEFDAGIIAMATHARRGVARLLFGSVADKVVRGTSRTVLLYRPD